MPGVHKPVKPTRKKCSRLTQTLGTKMKCDLQIDRYTGDVVVGNLTVTSATKHSDIEPLFRLGAEIPVRVLRETIPCMFATATVEDGQRRIKVELRFEHSVLVSIFFELLDEETRYPDSRSYFESQTERYDEHLQWLREKLGSNQDSYTQYRWGLVGVANGKGGEVHIFIHNTKNGFAGCSLKI
jgi:hypothetical protein